MLRIIFLLLFVTLLSGCFIAPGMKQCAPPALAEQAANNHVCPCFIPITAELIRCMKQADILNQDDAYYYHVDPHDVLNVFVWGHQELNGPVGQVPSESGANPSPTIFPAGFLVSTDGNIYYPLVGTVHVAGQTVEQIRSRLTSLLRRYVRNPQLDVRVSGFRSKKIYILGEVFKPGLQPITDSPLNIVDAITLAGGLEQKSADPSRIFVIRGNYARPTVYWLNAQSADALLLAQNFRLKNHDVVFVSTAEVARWNRAIDQILPSIQAVWFTDSLIRNYSN